MSKDITMDDILSKWLNNEISDEELKSHLGENEASKYIQIIGEVDKWVPDQSSQLFDPKTITSRPKGKVISMRPVISYAAAAVILLTIVSYFWLIVGNDTFTYSTAIGEVKEITLPDSISTVTLAANSEISLDMEDWESSKRKVELNGKALFKVDKGDPFEVKSSSGTVEVLGTTFEVDDFEEGFSVICYEGKVAASAKTESKKIIVARGEGYRYFDGLWEERIEINRTLPAWIQNQTKFENAPLAQVIKTIEKTYGVTFDKGEVNISKRFTGTIPNDKLEVALKIVFTPFKIRYSQKDKTITLSEAN